MPEVVFISVVRDLAMHQKCTERLWGNDTMRINALDNRSANESIPILYNRFLETFDYSNPAWLVFCHEDFEIDDDLGKILDGQDKSKMYGPIGAKMEHVRPWLLGGNFPSKILGSELESNKDGSACRQNGSIVPPHTQVDTFDCQCLIVHSSLIDRFKLRFDEKLTFDLYVEDFCANAFVKHGIVSEILPFKCHHWSYGNVCERYHKALHYLDGKYKRQEFPSTVGYTFGAGRTFLRRRQRSFRRFLDRYMPWLATGIVKVISR